MTVALLTFEEFIQKVCSVFHWEGDTMIRYSSWRGEGENLFCTAWSAYTCKYRTDGTWFYAARGHAGTGSTLQEAMRECSGSQSSVWRAEARLRAAMAKLEGDRQRS